MDKAIQYIKYRIRDSLNIRKKLIRVFAAMNLQPLYYKLISNAFSAEQKRILNGINQYHKDTDVAFLLRRNTHRLEKGLIMRPRRIIFGEKYILETVCAYEAYSKRSDADKNLLKWSFNILKTYFNSVGYSLTIEKSERIFINSKSFNLDGEKEFLPLPFKRSESEYSSVTYKDLLMLSLRRRSIRWYQKKGVDRAIIDSAIKISLLAPSACNRQPFRYQVFDDPSLVKAIINIPGGTNGWSHSPPVVVALIGQLNAFAEERDKHIIYIDSSLSAMAFMYALETLGLGSCAINFPDIPKYHQEVQKYARLKAYETTIMLIALGYADEDALVPFSAKKDLENLREYNNERTSL